MDLQFVFGNPLRNKKTKSLAMRKKSSKINRKEDRLMKINVSKRTNPPVYYRFTKKGSKVRKSKTYMDREDRKNANLALDVLKKELEKASKNNEPLAALTKQINKIQTKISLSEVRSVEAREQKKKLKDQGWDAVLKSTKRTKRVIAPFKPKKTLPPKVYFTKEQKKLLKRKALGKELTAKQEAIVRQLMKKPAKRKPVKRKTPKKAVTKKKTIKKTKRSKPVAKKRKAKKTKKLTTKQRSEIAKKASRKRKRALNLKKKEAEKKRKAAKRRKATGRKKPVVRKKRKVSKKRKVAKRKSRKMRTIATGKVKRAGKTYRVRTQMNPKRRNPMKMANMFKPKNLFSEKGIGWTGLEGLGLFGGGALYGQVNKLASRVPFIRQALEKIPFVGPVVAPAIPTLLVGTILNILGKSQKIKAMEVIGRGLVGSAVVGIGVNAGEQIPGLKTIAAPVAGYDNQLGAYDSSQLGQYKESKADFGAVDYTPEVGGVDFAPEGEADFGGVDYTPEGESDFGGMPEGMV